MDQELARRKHRLIAIFLAHIAYAAAVLDAYAGSLVLGALAIAEALARSAA